MRVLYDHLIFQAQTYGGISHYFKQLIDRLPPDIVQAYVFSGLHVNSDILLAKAFKSIGVRDSLPKFFSPLRKSFNFIGFHALNRLINPDIIHHTYYPRILSHKLPSSRSKRIITVYDFIHEEFGKHLKNSQEVVELKRRAILSADHLICISETTKKSLLSRYNDVAADRVSVCHLGAPDYFHGRELSTSPREPFILFVGQRGGYKNFLFLLEVFLSQTQFRDGFRLICVGGEEFSSHEKALLETYKAVDRVSIMHGCSEHRKFDLLSRASVLVSPSLAEGFGLPLVEAFACSCPLICSDIEAHREVAGSDAAILFDPSDKESLSDALFRVLFNDEVSDSLVRSGNARRKLFSWEVCAKNTQDIYERTLAE